MWLLKTLEAASRWVAGAASYGRLQISKSQFLLGCFVDISYQSEDEGHKSQSGTD